MKKVIYRGEEILTRGNYGETIRSGRTDGDSVYVWDSTYGWFNFGPLGDDWEVTNQEVESVQADW